MLEHFETRATVIHPPAVDAKHRKPSRCLDATAKRAFLTLSQATLVGIGNAAVLNAPKGRQSPQGSFSIFSNSVGLDRCGRIFSPQTRP